MKTILLFIFSISTLNSTGQVSEKLNDKWAFLGNGILYFEQKNDSIYVDFMEQSSYRFIDFYKSSIAPNEKRELRFVNIVDTIESFNLITTMKFQSRFSSKLDTLRFLIKKKNLDELLVSGKIVYDYREKSIKTNNNCDTSSLFCSLQLLGKNKINEIKKLKPVDEITKIDLTAFLNKFEKKIKTKCNICSEPFFVSDINKIIIELGYNPISTYEQGNSTIYKTSALYELTFLLATKHKDLNERYKKILDKFYFNRN